ncbi:hypothetical protein KR018_004708, partial [Drosophila ironensis]
QFLTKSSSARHSLLVLLLVACCLGSAFGAKITKKVEKPAQPQSTGDKSEAESAAAAAAAVAKPEEEEADDDDDDDDEETDDDDEEEEEPAKGADKEAAASGSNKNPTAVQAATDPTDLSVWGMVRTLWGWLRSDLSESLFGDDDDGKPTSGSAAVEGRTFGKIRRLQMALIPIIFKFGVLSAMVAFLVAIGMKSLFLLKVLVVMNAIAILGKFITLKSSLFGSYEHTAPSFNYPGWNPHAKESWGTTGLSGGHTGLAGHPPSKEIHLHIHGNAQTQAQLAGQGYTYESQGGWASRSDPYGAYAPTGQFAEGSSQQQQQQQGVGEVAVPNNTDPMSLLPTKYRARRLIR